MRASISRLASLLVLPVIAACSGVLNTTDPSGPEPVQLPGSAYVPLKAPSSAPEDLPGVDTSQLSRRERELYWKMVTELYSPCASEAVSLAVCVKEKRACIACLPAVKLLVDKIHEGASTEQAQTVYATRFGPKLKEVDIADSPTEGPAGAPVTIVEWYDFECPHCKATSPILEKIVHDHMGQVRVVKKYFPLHQHARAEPAARAAIAASNQHKYWEMERILFKNQSELTDADFEKYAQQLGLDMKRFKDDLTADKTTKILERDRADADRLGLSGTPFILINGREFDLALFHLDSDLEPWIDLEVKLKTGRSP